MVSKSPIAIAKGSVAPAAHKPRRKVIRRCALLTQRRRDARGRFSRARPRPTARMCPDCIEMVQRKGVLFAGKWICIQCFHVAIDELSAQMTARQTLTIGIPSAAYEPSA